MGWLKRQYHYFATWSSKKCHSCSNG